MFTCLSRLIVSCVLVLVACQKPAQDNAVKVLEDGSQLAAITAEENGFVPSAVQFAQGKKATLRFTRTSKETCADKVVFPELKLKRDLPLNQPVDLDVPTDSARSLSFQCGMGMYKSSVVIR